MKYILRTGTLIVIHVNDPEGLILKFHTGVGIFYGTGAYTGASYSADRKAYTLVVPKGLKATLFIDTLLLLNDAMGNSLPVDAGVMPFQAAGEEIDLSFSVTAALVNAASYLPGIDEGAIATLFGSGFTDVSGVYAANTLPLPILIAGTSVKVNGIAAPLLAVIDEDGKSQINFQVPHSPGYIGSSFVIVVENHGKAQTFYTRQWGQLGVFPTLAHETGEAITAGNAALRGEQVFVYWTGVNGFDFFDTVTGSIIPDGQPSPATAVCAQYFSPQVKVGGIAADVSSCAAAPGLVGIGQLVFTVPMGLSAGSHDVVVDLASIRGNTVELPVAIP